MKKSEELSIKIKAKKRPLYIIFILLWISIYINILIQRQTIYQLDILIIIIGGLFLMFAIWQLFGKVSIVVNPKRISIHKSIGQLTFSSKEYALNEISNVKLLTNQNEDTYWAVTGLRFYHKSPITIDFVYRGKTITIGKSLESFPGLKIVRILQQKSE